ncbi:MAG: radical SAM family heme chaperone HemW [Nitrospinae bacterium]|nr:radical SAM family heme chaperone HemW [Nitrospinota bacterium]
MDGIYDEYVEALKNEIFLYNPSCPPLKKGGEGGIYDIISIFFGGGTPTILESWQLLEILEACRGLLNLTTDPEVTIEANPETLTKDKLKELRKGGFNRISIGVQSFNDRLLKRLGRIHDSKKAYQGILSARDAGFENISIDLMFGIPDETLKDWESDIETALELNPEHISAYNLTVEKGTEFWSETQAKACGYQLPDEDRQLEMYERGIELLISAGYEHYEISNFAKTGRRCLHNQIYWKNEKYLGIGAGAYSYINGERQWNIKNPVEYINKIKGQGARGKGQEIVAGSERLEDKKIMGETIMMGLRMIEGINLQSFKKRFNTEIQSVFHTATSKLLNNNLISFNNGYLKLTKKGLLFYNDAASEFLV